MLGFVAKLGSCRAIHKLFVVSAILGVFICVSTLSKFACLNISNTFCNPFNKVEFHGGVGIHVRERIDFFLQKIREEIDITTHHHKDGPVQLSGTALRYYTFLNEILELLETVQASLVMDDVESDLDGEAPPPANQSNYSDTPTDTAGLFGQLMDMDNLSVEEIHKYVEIKPNKLGKQNFMGANGTFTSIGHACLSMKEDLEEYMDYNLGQICNDDWKLSHKLLEYQGGFRMFGYKVHKWVVIPKLDRDDNEILFSAILESLPGLSDEHHYLYPEIMKKMQSTIVPFRNQFSSAKSVVLYCCNDIFHFFLFNSRLKWAFGAKIKRFYYENVIHFPRAQFLSNGLKCNVDVPFRLFPLFRRPGRKKPREGEMRRLKGQDYSSA